MIREDIMKASTDRIITTHAGSLPRPPELLKLVRAKVAGQPTTKRNWPRR
jgi:methionine synthase II (cobalamin-independent)